MPTGHTAAIADGISFKEYAMSCARAFGALVTMRDEPLDAEIPEEFKPSTYHLEKLQESRENLRVLDLMNFQTAQIHASMVYSKAEEQRLKRLEELKNLRIKYETMLSECKKYVAPTPDHVDFRNFMIKQIEESIQFDCGSSYYDKPTVLLTGEEWLNQKIEQAEKDIKYHTQEYEKDCKRADDRNGWLKALRESLK